MYIIYLLFFVFTLQSSQVNSSLIATLNPHANFGGQDGLIEFPNEIQHVSMRPESSDLVIIYTNNEAQNKLALVNAQGEIKKETLIDTEFLTNSTDADDLRQEQILCDTNGIYLVGYKTSSWSGLYEGQIYKFTYDLESDLSFGYYGLTETYVGYFDNQYNFISNPTKLFSLYKTTDGRYYAGGGVEIDGSYTPMIAEFNSKTGAFINNSLETPFLYNEESDRRPGSFNNMIIVNNKVIRHNSASLETYNIDRATLVLTDEILSSHGTYGCIFQYDKTSFLAAENYSNLLQAKIYKFNVLSDGSLEEVFQFQLTNEVIGLQPDEQFRVRSLTLFTTKLFLWIEYNNNGNLFPLIALFDTSDTNNIRLDTSFFETGYWKYETSYNSDYQNTSHGFLHGLLTNSALPTLLGRTDTKIITTPLRPTFFKEKTLLQIVRKEAKEIQKRLQLEQTVDNTIVLPPLLS